MLLIKKLFFTAVTVAAAFTTFAADGDGFSYLPEFHGAIRSRWEADTRTGDQRFQVRNARLSIGGNVAPSISYFFQTDLCDRGKIKILDAWGRMQITKGLLFQAGQFRMPFGVEAFYAPANYYFSNLAFMADQVMNYRAVGAKVGYTLPRTPLTLEFGAFNPTPIGEHNVWNRTLAYSGKALMKFSGGWTLSTGYASIRPGGTRANLIDAYAGYSRGHWLVAGEYIWEHYCNRDYKDVHSYLIFADWHKAVDWGVFNRWSIQARFDGMTDHFSITQAGDVFDAARDRVTVGSTLTYQYKKVNADVRLNYEKYVKWDGDGKSPDRFVAELIIHF